MFKAKSPRESNHQDGILASGSIFLTSTRHMFPSLLKTTSGLFDRERPRFSVWINAFLHQVINN